GTPLVREASGPPAPPLSATEIRPRESRLHQQGPQPSTHVGTCGMSEELVEHLHSTITQRGRRPAAMDDGEIVFVKDCQASRVKHGSTGMQHGERVLRMNKNVPADNGVELTSGLPLMNIGMHAFDVFDAFREPTMF